MGPVIRAARVTPVLVADPPLLNVQGVHQPYTPRTIVEVETDEGVVGVGETYGDTAYLDLARAYAAALPGRDLHALNGLPRLLARLDSALSPADGSRAGGPAAQGRAAQGRAAGSATEGLAAGGLRGARTSDKLRASVVSAFEVACLDAVGHHAGLPVHALLGGKVRDRVEYSGYLFYRWAAHPGKGAPADDWDEAVDPEGIVRQARRFAKDYGFGSFKLKGGVFRPDQEIAAIRALAEAFPGAPLRLDPNGAWSVETSVRVAEELDGVLEYLEDPTLGVPGMAEVHRRTGMTLATNMCVTRTAEIPAAFAAGAVQVVLSDHHFWGGLLATRDLAAVCRAYGVGLSMHSNTHLGVSLAAMTQVAATVPDLAYACDSHRPWQAEDVITSPHPFADGSVEVSDAPGLGVTLDREALSHLHERWLALGDHSGYRDRDDAAAMRVVRPDWQVPTLPRW